MVMVMKILMITDTMNERMLKRGDDPLGGSKYISQSRHMHSQEQLLMMMLTAMVMVVMVMVVTMVWSQKHKLLYCSRCVEDWGGEILYNDYEIGMMSGLVSDDFCHFCFLRRDFYIEQNESGAIAAALIQFFATCLICSVNCCKQHFQRFYWQNLSLLVTNIEKRGWFDKFSVLKFATKKTELLPTWGPTSSPWGTEQTIGRPRDQLENHTDAFSKVFQRPVCWKSFSKTSFF